MLSLRTKTILQLFIFTIINQILSSYETKLEQFSFRVPFRTHSNDRKRTYWERELWRRSIIRRITLIGNRLFNKWSIHIVKRMDSRSVCHSSLFMINVFQNHFKQLPIKHNFLVWIIFSRQNASFSHLNQIEQLEFETAIRNHIVKDCNWNILATR